MSTSEQVRTLAQRVLDVQSQVERLERDEARVETAKANYRYRYIGESTMFEWLRDQLAEKGIVTYQSTSVLSTDGNMVRVLVVLTLVNADDASDREMVSMPGQATDQGDKAMAKAITSATRYLYWKLFRFPAEDPDADEARTSVSHVTESEQRAIAQLGQLRALAKQLGYVGSVEEQISEHLAKTGLAVPDERFVAGLLAQLHAAQQQAAATAAPAAAPQPDRPAPQPAPASSENASGDGQAALPPDDPFAVATQPSTETAQLVVTRIKAVSDAAPGVDWAKRIQERCLEWYGVDDWTRLDDDKLRDLATRLEQTQLALAERAAS